MDGIVKTMRLSTETATMRERIKETLRFTDEELENYFILAVLFALKSGAKFVKDKNRSATELYSEFDKIYTSMI